jgi:hypothetical protein
MLKVFYCTDFEGHYPIGTAAVMVAENKEQAKLLLENSLKDDLPQVIEVNDIHEMDLNNQGCNVLHYGNY